MDPESFVYEVRYGWNGRTGLTVAASFLFVVLGFAVPLSAGLRIADVLLFGVGGLLMLGVVGSRQVAMRVDAEGVTLGGVPPRYRSGTTFVPWADIENVVLWKQKLPHGGSLPYVGLARRKDAPPLAGRPVRLLGRIMARAVAPQVSGDTLMASRAINGWRLDNERLAAAVEHFAPGVRLEAA